MLPDANGSTAGNNREKRGGGKIRERKAGERPERERK